MSEVLSIGWSHIRRGRSGASRQCIVIHISSAASPNTNDPCQEVYRGPAPESEKETKAVTNFIRSHLNSIKAYITFHSYSQMLLFPYGYTSKLPPNHSDLVCKYIHISQVSTFKTIIDCILFFINFDICWNGFTLFSWLFWDTVLLCNSSWLWTHYVPQPHITLTTHPALASQILEIQFWHHTKASHFKYQKKNQWSLLCS